MVNESDLRFNKRDIFSPTHVLAVLRSFSWCTAESVFFYRAFVPIKKPRHFKRDPAAGHLVGIMGDLPRPCKHGQLKKWASVHEEPLISSVVGSLTRATCCSSNSLAFLVRITGSMDVLGGGHSKLFAAGGIV